MKIRTTLVLFVLVVAACGEPSSVGEGDTLEGAWQLRSATVDGEPITLLDDHRVTATITDDQIGGRAACNSYGATMRVADGAVTFENMSWTEMGCEQPVMALEQAYMGALMRVTSADRSGPALLLTGPDVELEFALLEPVATADLVGVTWVLSGIVVGDTVTSPAEGADPGMLVLREDGTLTGHTGCRGLSGEYIVTGDEVHFTTFAADGDCSPELQWQDNQVVTVLGDGFTADIVGDRLTLGSTGGEGLVFTAGS